MVWGLFPVDPLPGEDNYYFFNKGTYKVGRKGCDVIVNKDKGVSRIHAEILIDEMSSLDHSLKKPSNILSKVRVRDCSKYGTFLNKNLDLKEKVHEFPNKETMLKDGDLVSFGTGNATYRFSYVSFIFFICSLKHSKTNQLITKKVSSIGASITKKWSLNCSHVLVDDSFPLSDDLIDAIVARKPLVQYSWVELIAGKNICTNIPSYSFHAPKLMLEGVSVKVVDPQSRECCLKGYAFLLEPENKYNFEGRLQSLLEVGGANISSEMVSEKNGNDLVVCVAPAGSSNFKCFSNQSSLPWVSEIDLVSAVLSGYLDPSLITSPPVLVTSSCSTDETVVADSDAETESTKSDHIAAAFCSIESSEHDSKGTTSTHKLESVEYHNKDKCSVQIIIPKDKVSTRDTSPSSTKHIKHDGGHIPHDDATIHDPEGGYIRRLGVKSDNTTAKEDITDERENGKLDIIYSHDLIVRDSIVSLPVSSLTNGGVANFKRFRKANAPSQNSFAMFIPFSKHPYQESECKNEDVAESIKEEKKRKQMEAIAEDLFKSEKGRQRGVAGSLHGLFARR
ncbi:nibrin homolog isoform X2 [Solanum dulcamara]|uniref:nibrin homolog isoform X2 n=1 Tax=Solanum dulcamara TaxID=45834 RepID=UPI002485486A|nr:nibrin homolog isoform X2 [Solanum dulcamara]